MNKIAIVLCEVGKPARVELVPQDFKFQDILNDDANYLNFADLGIQVYFGENRKGGFNREIGAKVLKTSLNRKPDFVIDRDRGGPLKAAIGKAGTHRLHGPFFFTKADNDGKSVSLNESDILKLSKFLGEPIVSHTVRNRSTDNEETRP